MGRKGTGVEVRPNSIRISFTLDGEKRRETLTQNGQPLPPTPANIKYANRLSNEIREKIRYGVFSMAEYFPASGHKVGAVTLADQLDTWLGGLSVAFSTHAAYVAAANFWKKSPADKSGTLLGSIPLRALVLSQIKFAIASRSELSEKTQNNYKTALRDALNLAVADRLIADNPALLVKSVKYQKKPAEPFSREESEAIIAHITERYSPQVANLVEFWFWTGMRTSEVFGLNWESIDLKAGTALVKEALIRGRRTDKTKTGVARTVLLNSRAMAAIQRQRQHTQVKNKEVFQNPTTGEAWDDERKFRREYWSPTLKLLGLHYRRPYNMRHSYATAMLMVGMTPAFCAKQLGHSVEEFLRTYSKWIDGERNDLEMARLEASLGNNPGNNRGILGV